jgi:hypothetical protein
MSPSSPELRMSVPPLQPHGFRDNAGVAQVPAKIIYLSDGPNKRIELGSRIIHFKHARSQTLIDEDGKSALVVQALRSLGKENMDRNVTARLRDILSDSERRKLLKMTRFGVDWIYETATKIAGDTA